ncbi:MAG: hypothetical protein WCL06_07065 [Bacteroidota bacterium]
MKKLKTASTPKKKSAKARHIPYAFTELSALASQVNTAWIANPQITLVWLTQAEFETKASQFEQTIRERKNTGSTRPQFTAKLKQIDKTINDGVGILKGYLIGKYGRKLAPSYYAAFGFVKTHQKYKLPIDRNQRRANLEFLVNAISVHGFQNYDLGLAYWTDIKSTYETLTSTANSIDGAVSSKVGQKNILRGEIRLALNALIHVLKGNYPQTYKSVLRGWGFQKEKY